MVLRCNFSRCCSCVPNNNILNPSANTPPYSAITAASFLIMLLSLFPFSCFHPRVRKTISNEIFFFAQFTNHNYEYPTVNKSAYEFPNFLRDGEFFTKRIWIINEPQCFFLVKITKNFGNLERGQCSAERFFVVNGFGGELFVYKYSMVGW
jgi:hypothetical protein